MYCIQQLWRGILRLGFIFNGICQHGLYTVVNYQPDVVVIRMQDSRRSSSSITCSKKAMTKSHWYGYVYYKVFTNDVLDISEDAWINDLRNLWPLLSWSCRHPMSLITKETLEKRYNFIVNTVVFEGLILRWYWYIDCCQGDDMSIPSRDGCGMDSGFGQPEVKILCKRDGYNLISTEIHF